MEQKDYYNGFDDVKKLFIYGILYPIGLIAFCCVAEWLERLII